MDRLIEPLKATCNHKVKPNAVKQEFEKQDELKRSALRAFLSLMAVPDADKSHVVTQFYDTIIKNADLANLLEQIRKDSQLNVSPGDSAATPMDIS